MAGVVEALDLIGSQQIQGRCSLAGNLCNASPAADSVPALFAAGAIAVVVGSKGRREVPVEQIPTGPGRTSLAKDEFILEFKFPPRPPRSGDAYLRFIPRTEMDIAVVGCGINVTLDDKGVCTAARVALGAVAPTVLLVPDAATALIGHTLDADTLAKLDATARAACKPINDKRGTIEYRTKVAGVLARRVAAIAFDRAIEDLLKGKAYDDALFAAAGKIASEDCEPVADIHASEEHRRHVLGVLTKRMLKKAWEQARG